MKISIIIPVFNKENYLKRCFDSILNQIKGNENKFEILVVNDGSSDNSMFIIEEYAKRNRVFNITTQQNAGVSVARNVALNLVTGDYALFLDADDELIDGALLKVYNLLEQNGPIDMLVTRQTRFDGISEKQVKAPNLIENRIYNGVEAYKNHYVRLNAGGGICRTDFIRRYSIQFPEGVRNSEDTIFFGLIQTYADSIMFLDIPLYRIHVLEGSASRIDNTKLAIRHIDTINAVVKARNELKCSDEQKGVFEFYVFQLLSNAMGKYIKSSKLGFRNFCTNIDIPKILPLTTKYMHMMKHKAILLNFSYKLYYMINWLKFKIK